MDRKTILKEMRDCVGAQSPVIFFDKMVDVFTLLFDRIDELEDQVKEANLKAALAIKWEPRLASGMITEMIDQLREDRDTYIEEISQLKKAFIENKVTQSYDEFCRFWQDVLGYHPFLDYDR
jgi:ATP-dependent helicase/DNAse subunit B